MADEKNATDYPRETEPFARAAPDMPFNAYPPQHQGAFNSAAYPAGTNFNQQQFGSPAMNTDQNDQPFDLKDQNVRVNFVRKVYAIVSFLLVITLIFAFVARFSPSYEIYMRQNPWVIVVASIVMVVLLYALGCYRKLSRSVPINYILLFIFGLAQSVVVSYVSAQVDTTSFIIAVGLTTATVLTISIYACLTKKDLGFLWPLAAVFGVVLIMSILIGIFVHAKWLVILISGLSCILFSIYLLLHTQMVITTNEKGYSIDDYIFAALNIYTDIVQLFLNILRLVSAARN